jgi:hypothetical protein
MGCVLRKENYIFFLGQIGKPPYVYNAGGIKGTIIFLSLYKMSIGPMELTYD